MIAVEEAEDVDFRIQKYSFTK